ncbi:MAG: Na+/H+ antiporter subunit E [Acidimicrobiales bacterium]|nr:Na+/H+ antiporter subunit E [Acidimicrobiales bacterium]
MNRLVRVALILAVWLALWSEVSVANVLSGLALAGVIVLGFDTWSHGPLILRPLRAVRFAAFFAYLLVLSTWAVVRTVVAPRDRVHTGILAVPLHGCSDAVATLIADAITLTPGTLTLEVRREPLTLYVHALDTRDLDSIRRDVRRLEVLAVRAFGDAGAIEGLAVDDTTAWRQP